MTPLEMRFARLDKKGVLAPIKGLPCPLCSIDFSDCEHSIAAVENAIRVWRDRQTAQKLFGT